MKISAFATIVILAFVAAGAANADVIYSGDPYRDNIPADEQALHDAQWAEAAEQVWRVQAEEGLSGKATKAVAFVMTSQNQLFGVGCDHGFAYMTYVRKHPTSLRPVIQENVSVIVPGADAGMGVVGKRTVAGYKIALQSGHIPLLRLLMQHSTMSFHFENRTRHTKFGLRGSSDALLTVAKLCGWKL